MSLQACPNCGSTDLNVLEVGEAAHDTIHECENCEEQIREEEL